MTCSTHVGIKKRKKRREMSNKKTHIFTHTTTTLYVHV